MNIEWLHRLSTPPRAQSQRRRRRVAHRALPCVEEMEDRCVLSTLTVNGSQSLQTIAGFGTNLSSEAWNSGAVVPSLNTLLSHGYKLFRVIVEPVQGWEETNPNTGQYSDSNPNWAYYNNLYGTSTKFTNLWNTISYLNNHGATVWVNLQSDAPAWMTDSGGGTGTIGPDHEADWATMVSTMMDYAVNTAHVHIDALGPMNEPDNPGDPVQGPQVSATQYVRMLDTLETQLQGYGLGNIPLVGPDNANTSSAVSSYVPAMLADSFLMPHVMQFGFHSYGGTASDSAITSNSSYPGRQILSDEYDGSYFNEDHGQRATPAQLWTQADGSFQDLMAIVSAGENGAVIWDGVDNFYEYYQQWSAHGLISYDWTAPNPTAPSDYGTTPRLYANAQMFQFVAPGSVVIGSSTNASNLLELAFKNPNGQITIVGENTGSSSQSITGTLTGGLNTSLFNMYFTNSSLNEQQQSDVPVTNNTFQFTVPTDTIFTLTMPAAPSVASVDPISGLTTGGESVTITGSNFTGATGVSFEGIASSTFTVNSDTSITAIAPAESAGTVDVTVVTPNGSSATSAAEQFQYVAVSGTAPPTVASAASATLSSSQISASLSVLGASQYAANELTYTWSTTGTPPAPVTFSTNGSNSASNVTASFSQAGSYNFQVTITDPAGNSVTSSVQVTVNQVATTLTVSPTTGTVVPSGTFQFSDTASDQFRNPYTASPIAWTVGGGGTIDSTGKFTAGSVTGGPFTVTASAGGLNATATITISSNVNLAPSGTAYRWYGMSSASANTNQVAAPGLNDNNLTNNVVLTGGSDDVANAYEAGGIIWTTLQSVNTVSFTNGSFNSSSYDGVFDNNFGLQTTTNGTTWTSASGWSVSPAYQYNSSAAAGVTYTFTGPALSVLGVRVVGQVHSLGGNDSWYDDATEIQAFGTGTFNSSPTVSSLNPSSGALSGGVSVIITGSNFNGATGVSFGGAALAASSFTVNSATQITAVAPAASAAGSVDVTVTTPSGTSATSASDQFTYVAAPNITSQPTSQTVNVGQSASFSVTASGTGTLTYQWKKLVNGTWTNLSGATSSTYTITVAATTDAGSYWVIVASLGGSVTSSAATLTVNLVTPAAPTGVVATSANSQVSLSWSPSTGATSYRIYRGTASNGETLLASPTGAATTYVDSAVTNGTTYYYEVTAVNSTGESPRSAEVSAAPQPLGGNIGPSGTAYRWWDLTSSTSNSNRNAAPGLNDNNLTTDVVLSGSGSDGQGGDYKNAYEAAGILWSSTQSIAQVNFINGSYSASDDGVFDANFGMQYTTNGTTWVAASSWTITPSYAYNSSSAARVTYTFTGPALNVLGVRIVGQVHTSNSGVNSWFDRATEVQVYNVQV
ncbi:MAG: IPT/TIG domain-containing protein [Isosphaeraceae bacterium]